MSVRGYSRMLIKAVTRETSRVNVAAEIYKSWRRRASDFGVVDVVTRLVRPAVLYLKVAARCRQCVSIRWQREEMMQPHPDRA